MVKTVFMGIHLVNPYLSESLPLSRTYVIKTQHNNNTMLIPNLTR